MSSEVCEWLRRNVNPSLWDTFHAIVSQELGDCHDPVEKAPQRDGDWGWRRAVRNCDAEELQSDALVNAAMNYRIYYRRITREDRNVELHRPTTAYWIVVRVMDGQEWKQYAEAER